MKPKSTFRSFLFLAGSLLASPSTYAVIYYWDSNSNASGYGTAVGGTWAEPTANGWSTSNVGNQVVSSQTILLADSVNFGTATAGVIGGTITVTGTVDATGVTFGAPSGEIILSGGIINLAAAASITVNNATDTIASEISSAGTSLTKLGTGTLKLTGTNTYTGNSIASAGTLDLGGGGGTGSLASTVLTLNSSGGFSFTRNDSATQTFTTTNLNGNGTLSVASGNTLNLGTVARGNGGIFDFSTAGLGTVTADAASNAGDIMPSLTLGNSWAVANGAGVAISGLANGSYTATTGLAANAYAGNIDVDSIDATPDAASTVNSLRFSEGAANILTLAGNNTITTGGILVSSDVANNLSTITGGTLVGAASKDLSVIQKNTLNGLTISSIIANNGGATALTKSGAGLLTLSNSNTFTGGLIIYGGEVRLNHAGALFSTVNSENAVTFGSGSTGTLSLNSNSVVVRSLGGASGAFVQNANAAPATLTIGNSGNASSTFGGIIQDGSGSAALSLAKSGTGTLTLNGDNTYTGTTVINAGVIEISHANALGTTAGNTTIAGTGQLKLLRSILNDANGITSPENITITGSGTAFFNNSQRSSTLSGNVTLASPSGNITFSTANGGSFIVFSGTITQTGTSRDLILSTPSSGGQGITINNPIANNGGKLLITAAGTSLLKGVNATDGTGIGETVISAAAGTVALLKLGVSNAINTTASLTIGSTVGGTNAGKFDLAGFNQTVNALIGNGTEATNSTRTVTNSAAGTGTSTLTVGNGGGSATFNGLITNGATAKIALIKTGAGTQTLTGVNTYTGTTAVNGGTLELGVDDCLANTSNVLIGAGTLKAAAGVNDTVGTLDATAAATINLGDSVSTLAFANSSGVTGGVWAGALNITGTFVSGNDVDPGAGVNPGSIRFGVDNTGLTASQLADITVNGSGTYTLDAFGYLKASGGGPGPLDHFDISAISSPQTVGTPITGITLTAKDASNVTVTGFTGTVNFSGTGGFSGTSGTFSLGELTGVSVTPSVSGSGLTFIVTDPVSTKFGTATITTIQTQYVGWSGASDFDVDTNGDGVKNGLAFLLGAANKNDSALNKLPIVTKDISGNLIMTFQCLKDASRGSATLNVEHSSNLGISDAWLGAPVTNAGTPLNNVSFSVGSASATLNNVTATISNTEAASGKLFGRLKANNP